MFHSDSFSLNRHINRGLLAGRPILHAEGQFVACHFSPCQYVPFRKIGRRNLKDILRKATDKRISEEKTSFKNASISKDMRSEEFEMIFLSDEYVEENQNEDNSSDGTDVDAANDTHPKEHQNQNRFVELLKWISREGEEFVYVETFSDVKEVLSLVDVIGTSNNPILTTVLVRDDDCGLVTVSLSSVKVDVQCLLFCMFQA